MGPLAIPAWAGEKTGQNVQIYKTEDVVKQVTVQEKAPEQSKPATTESKDDDADKAAIDAKENCAATEEKPGYLMQHLSCGPLGSWLECNRVKVSGHIEVGYTWNPDRPHDRQNFGRLFDDRSNDFRLNQALITFERALDPQACCADWGFKLQMMYGSDSRFVHSLGFMDNVVSETVQPDIVEAYGTYHLPVLTDGGVDILVGQMVTLQGAEVIYAPANPLYSHSYIFNFGIPFKHTGVMATTHVNSQLDIKAGIVAGINTGSFDDNNDALAFHGGFSWKSCDERLNIIGSLHAGPENDGVIGPNSNDDFRWIESLQVIYKAADNLTLITDVNAGKDETIQAVGDNSEWYGIAQYAIWQMNKCVAGVARIEVFRDDDGFAVFKDVSNDGFINIERGESTGGAVTGGGDSTYTELTLGLNIKPYENLLIRPEARWDWASGGNAPFDDSSDNNQFTLGLDVILFF
jgi:hypothetical protein